MDIRYSRRPLHSGLPLAVRRDPVGPRLARAAAKKEFVVRRCPASEAMSAAAGWDKIAPSRVFSQVLPIYTCHFGTPNLLRYIISVEYSDDWG